MSSRGGQANEAGSVFRRSVATFLAVRGLLGRDVPGFELGDKAHPVGLEFETDEATDDITCQMATGEAAFISVKRAAGNDRAFRDTVGSWVRQAARMNDGDLLVLATSQLRGDVKQLPEALERRRKGLGGSSVGERRAQKALDALMKDVEPSVRQRVLDAARVFIVPASATGHLDQDQFVGQIEGTLVAFDSGAPALDLLAAAFHAQAAAATGSNLDGWVRTLRAGGIEVYPDLQGPMGARIAARQRSLECYRHVLRESMGSLDLSLLAADLPALKVSDMLDSIVVTFDGEGSSLAQPLIHAVRRWGRLVLFGLPGAGKSTALRELAGTVADNEDAPTAVHVSLRVFAGRDPGQPLGLHDLLAGSVERVPPDQRPALAAVLTELAEVGDVLFLCDGLDECGKRAGWVSEQLGRILSGLPGRTGLVLATRSSAALAAEKLDVPTATLRTPTDLRSTLTLVLQACAERRINAQDRARWLAVREKWLRDARSDHKSLLDVPLMAILLALVAAEADDDDLPHERAVLLHRAIADSVRIWEDQRGVARLDWLEKQAPSGKMLLDGFTILGTILGSVISPSRTECLAALTAFFCGDRWRQAPAEAEETAEEVLYFWDEHVAVFVVGVDGILVSRSKIFVEVAEAMATLGMGREQLVDWVRDHLVYVESEGALSLALGLNAGAVAALLELGQRPGFANAPLFLADVVLGSELELTTPQVNELVDQLATHAQAATNGAQTPTRTRRSPSKIAAMLDATSRQETVHSPAWPFIRRLSQMSLAPGEAFDTRTRAIAGTQLSTDLQTVAAALVAVGRAHDEGRPLTSNEVHAVQAALDLPLPPPPEAVYETRRRIRIGDGKPAIAGLPTLARRAIAYLGQLEARSAEAIYDLGQASTAYQADRIGRELVLAGVDIVPWERKPRWRKAMASLWEGVADARDEEIVMKDIAAISDIAVELGRDDRWSLASIANLLAASGYAETTFGEFRAALRHDTEDLRIRWFQALAKAYGIDPVLSAAQARHILASADLKDMWQMITTRPATEVQIRKNVALPKEDQEVLVDCLTAASSWIAWSAAEILANNPFPGASQRLLALLSTNRQRWDRMIAMVAAVVADDPDAAAVALASAPESAYRAGAADSLIVRNVSTGTGRELLVRLAADDDLTVRSATHGKRKSAEIVAPEAAATYWSCSWCGHINMLTDSDCVACELASIPELNPNTLS